MDYKHAWYIITFGHLTLCHHSVRQWLFAHLALSHSTDQCWLVLNHNFFYFICWLYGSRCILFKQWFIINVIENGRYLALFSMNSHSFEFNHCNVSKRNTFEMACTKHIPFYLGLNVNVLVLPLPETTPTFRDSHQQKSFWQNFFKAQRVSLKEQGSFSECAQPVKEDVTL